MNILYARVSTKEQNEQRQLESAGRYNIEKTFVDKISGKNTDRPELQRMLAFVREGDVIYIHDFSRIARNLKDLLDLIDYLEKKDVKLVSIKENLDTSTPTGKLMIQMIGAINEFEVNILHERQMEGIRIAKRDGKYTGRKSTDIDPVKWEQLYSYYIDRKISKTQFAKELNISRPTLNNLLNNNK